MNINPLVIIILLIAVILVLKLFRVTRVVLDAMSIGNQLSNLEKSAKIFEKDFESM